MDTMKMKSVESYAMKILSEHDCDQYTYGGADSVNIMKDLKTAYPNGMEFPYIDVANAILSISRPAPIVRSPYKTMYDTPNFCDSVEFEDLEQAKEDAIDTLHLWMQEEYSQWGGEEPTEEEKDHWDYMIFNCSAWIVKYNPDTDEYEDFWFIPDETKNEIGWKEYNEY